MNKIAAMIRTVELFVETIGGYKAAAERFGVTPTAICNWKTGDRFPAWALPLVSEIAQRNKLVLDPQLFRTKQPKPTTKPKRTTSARKPSRARGRVRLHLNAAE